MTVTLTDRELLLTLAYRRIRFENLDVTDDLRAVSPLDGCELADWFAELILALKQRDGLSEHDPAAEAAAVRVEAALDALLGEASDG